MARLVLTLVTGDKKYLEVMDIRTGFNSVRAGEYPYDSEWIPVEGDEIVRRDSVICVGIAPDEPLVSFGD